MEQFDLKDFNKLIEQVEGIKEQLTPDKEKAKRKERREQISKWITVSIAFISLFLTVNGIYKDNEKQSYDYWLSYLQFASEHPTLANGFDSIDNIPVAVIACRQQNHKHYDTTTTKFVTYAWFVARSLGAAERVLDMNKNDASWKGTIDSIISAHKAYIECKCFTRTQYSKPMQKEFEKIAPAQP
jgi:hypothetical protein